MLVKGQPSLASSLISFEIITNVTSRTEARAQATNLLLYESIDGIKRTHY